MSTLVEFLLAATVMATLVLVLLQDFIFFRRERRTCQKFPLFKLREDILWEMCQSKDFKTLEKSYDTTNAIIKYLHDFDIGFAFYSMAMQRVYGDLIKFIYSNKGQLTPEKLTAAFLQERNDYDLRLHEIVLQTIRKNSLLMRLSITKPGAWIFDRIHRRIAVIRFLRNHPERWKKPRKRYATIRQYSMIGRIEITPGFRQVPA